MAVVRPFRAIRYAAPSGADITALTAPPYDVIGPDLRGQLLARDAHNVAALELPDGALDANVAGNRYETGAATWRAWIEDGVLVEDSEAAIYVLEQVFEHRGRTIRRRAFFAAVDLESFSTGVILPHERTLPRARADRFLLTRACAANLSPVFGLFSDPAGTTDAVFARAVATQPVAHASGDDGVASTLWTITDPVDQALIADALSDECIFIADGHHRYETALAYRDERRAADGRTDGSGTWHPYDGVMMALVNMDDPDLVVMPTHRVADVVGEFDADVFWTSLSKHLEVLELPKGHPAKALSETDDQPSFLVKARGDDRVRLVRVPDGIDAADLVPGPMSAPWKRLDVALLQELVLSPLFDIHPDRPETLDRLTFVKDAHAALELVGNHDAAFIMRPTKMEQLRAVAISGETMPQKSTYFHPKLLSGMLFRSLA